MENTLNLKGENENQGAMIDVNTIHKFSTYTIADKIRCSIEQQQGITTFLINAEELGDLASVISLGYMSNTSSKIFNVTFV